MQLNLYMTELTVERLDVSLRWYRDLLGLTVERLDEANGFVLLSTPTGRLALRVGQPHPEGVGLVFEVADIDQTMRELQVRGLVPKKQAVSVEEGYERAVYHDPSGYRITFFAWTSPKSRK
jgi:catechol 2,3-dioxygenase-like lactoylglutathione lyase family enzyme